MRHFSRSHEGCGGKGFFVRSLWLAKMRHGHGGGGPFRGGFGGRFGGGGFDGGDDFSRGRKFSSEDLQVLLLALLIEEPRHGYELIKLLETRSNGFYTPSPGMVYPALTYLEEVGHTTVTTEGNRKRYALTDEGRAYVETNRERVDYLWSKLNFFAQKMGMVRRALAGEQEEDRGGTNPLRALMEARGKLKHLLMSRINASAEEQLRISQILDRASAEIEARPGSTEGGDS